METILIAVPQRNELEPLLAGFERQGHVSHLKQVGRLECHLIPSLNIVVAVCGHGKAQFAVQAQYLISQFPQSQTLFCVGAAGCLNKELKLGDMVVGTKTIEHDYKIRFFKTDPPCHVPDPNLLTQFRKTIQQDQFVFGVHFGPIASGDEDIVDPSRAQELRGETNALCVAWEGSGAARAAQFNETRFAEIRCITDGADPDASVSFHENCIKVMPHAAELLIAWRNLNYATEL